MPRKVRQATPHAEIGKRLRSARLALGQNNLGNYAEAAGIAANAYSQHETGAKRISLEAALALRERYGLTLDYIYAGDDTGLQHGLAIKISKA